MAGFLKFESIKTKLLLGFGTLSALTVGLGIVAYTSIGSLQSVNQLSVEVNQLKTEVTRTNQLALEFFLRDSHNPSFANTGNSRYLNQLNKTFDAMMVTLSELKENPYVENKNQIDSIKVQAATIKAQLYQMGKLMRRRGAGTYGIVGRFEQASKKLLKYDFGAASDKLTTFRVYEKDYLLTGNPEAVKKFQDAYYTFSLEAEQYVDSASIDSVISILTAYEQGMQELVEVEKQLGHSPDEGIQGELSNAFDKIHTILNHTATQILATSDSLTTRILVFTLLAIVLAIGIGLFLSFYLPVNLVRPILKLRELIINIGHGRLLQNLNTNYSGEVGQMAKAIATLNQNLWNVRHFALEVGKGNFDTEVNVFNDQGELGESLAEMRESLKKVANDERQRNWVVTGQAKFSELLRLSDSNIDSITEKLMPQLVGYVNAKLGGLYLTRTEGDKTLLELVSTYAYGRKRYVKKTIEAGEGLLGQIYLEAETTLISDLPADYIKIRSGLGEASPNCILMVPLKHNENCIGVLELGAFHIFSNIQIEFIEKVADNLASVLANIFTAQQTDKLLKESELQSEQIREGEEQMRQSLEELMSTQEEMKRREQELVERDQLQTAIFNGASDALFTVDANGKFDVYNNTFKELFGYTDEAITNGLSIYQIIPDFSFPEKADGQLIQAMGKSQQGVSFWCEYSISKLQTESKNHYLIFLRDITERFNKQKELEKAFKESERVNAELTQKETKLNQILQEAELKEKELKESIAKIQQQK